MALFISLIIHVFAHIPRNIKNNSNMPKPKVSFL